MAIGIDECSGGFVDEPSGHSGGIVVFALVGDGSGQYRGKIGATPTVLHAMSSQIMFVLIDVIRTVVTLVNGFLSRASFDESVTPVQGRKWFRTRNLKSPGVGCPEHTYRKNCKTRGTDRHN